MLYDPAASRMSEPDEFACHQPLGFEALDTIVASIAKEMPESGCDLEILGHYEARS